MVLSFSDVHHCLFFILISIDNSWCIFPVKSPDHPGFHYTPDGDKKDSPQTKEGPTPRRGRRKGNRSNVFTVKRR